MIKEGTKVLRVKHGDVLVIKRKPDMTMEDMDRMVEQIEMSVQGPGRVCCIFVDRLSDVRKLTEAQMNQHGWARMRK